MIVMKVQGAQVPIVPTILVKFHQNCIEKEVWINQKRESFY